jgi:KEOPS complex subunit Pcc1
VTDRFDHRATIDLDYGESPDEPSASDGAPSSEATARLVATSLSQDVGRIGGDRSRTAVERSGAVVTLEIAATDLTALRAAVNTWLSLASVAERVAGHASKWAADRTAA